MDAQNQQLLWLVSAGGPRRWAGPRVDSGSGSPAARPGGPGRSDSEHDIRVRVRVRLGGVGVSARSCPRSSELTPAAGGPAPRRPRRLGPGTGRRRRPSHRHGGTVSLTLILKIAPGWAGTLTRDASQGPCRRRTRTRSLAQLSRYSRLGLRQSTKHLVAAASPPGGEAGSEIKIR
jgi:hypothetical protein